MKKTATLNLIVPLGVDQSLFPWSVNFIKDYLDKSIPGALVQIIDLQSHEAIRAVEKKYRKLRLQVQQSIIYEGFQVFDLNLDTIFGLIGFLGPDFLRIARKHKMLRKTSRIFFSQKGIIRRLEEMQRDLAAVLERVVTEEPSDFGQNAPGDTDIWAFSVYNGTLFNCLSIARLIKQKFPLAVIIFGGDYFSFGRAKELLENSDLADSVIVGYGEEVLKRLMIESRDGKQIKDLVIPGLVNHKSLSLHQDFYQQIAVASEKNIISRGSGREAEWFINVPPAYRDQSVTDYIACVRTNSLKADLTNLPACYKDESTTPDDLLVRVMLQRGCSWGVCSFCNQYDSRLYYPFDREKVKEQLDLVLTEAISKFKNSDHQIIIAFDSDEICRDTLQYFLEYFNGDKFAGIRFTLVFWLRVKEFNQELATALWKNKPDRMTLKFALAIESCNPVTLKNMSKGITPLEVIQAAKVLQDCGYDFRANYFLNFPLETMEDIQQETYILRNILHLLVMPRSDIFITAYLPGSNDTIFKNREKFQAIIKPFSKDIWLKEGFGLNLEFSNFNYTCHEKWSWGLDRFLGWSYRQFICYFGSFKGFMYLALHFFIAIVSRRMAFMARINIALYLQKVHRQFEPSSSRPSNRKYYANFYIAGGTLFKQVKAPFMTTQWSRKLTQNELRVLRYLYWIRNKKELAAQFENEIGADAMGTICQEHLKLGSLIQVENSFICVVHDPEYWLDLTSIRQVHLNFS